LRLRVKPTQLGPGGRAIPYLDLFIWSVSQAWRYFPPGLQLFQQNDQCRVCVKIVFICWYHTENLSLWWWVVFW
jgi:hypothetical protein